MTHSHAVMRPNASTFNPANAGNPSWALIAWADDPLWTTGKPADGGLVSEVRNGGSTTGNPVQATGSRQPTYNQTVAGLNNRGAWTFDGARALLAAITDIAQPYCMVAVVKLAATGTARAVMGLTAGGGSRLGTTTSAWIMNAGTGLTAGTPDTNAHVLEAVVDGASSKLFVDGTQIGSTGNAGAGALADFLIGATATTGTNGWTGQIALAGAYAGNTRHVQFPRDAGTYYGITVA